MRRSKHFAAIAIVIVLIGAEQILDRLIGIPDIGRVTEVMTGGSLEKIADRFQKLGMRIVRINQMLDGAGIKTVETRRFNSSWVDLDRSWSEFKRKPSELKVHMRFERSLTDLQEVMEKFRPGVAGQIDGMNKHTGEILFFHIDSFSDAIMDLARYIKNESKAEVWIDGRSLGIVILVLILLVLFIIFYHMNSRQKRD